jgi:hypothetical protein
MEISGGWRRVGLRSVSEDGVRHPPTIDIEGAAGPPLASGAQARLPVALLERLEYRRVDRARSELANPHQGMAAVPRLSGPADFDFVTLEAGGGGHDGRAYVAAQLEDDGSGLTGRDILLHPGQEATDTGVAEGFEKPA